MAIPVVLRNYIVYLTRYRIAFFLSKIFAVLHCLSEKITVTIVYFLVYQNLQVAAGDELKRHILQLRGY